MAKPLNIILPGSCLFVGILIGLVLYSIFSSNIEGFQNNRGRGRGKGKGKANLCNICKMSTPCGCPGPRPGEHQKQYGQYSGYSSPDMSAFVLKSTIPPCPPQPDLSKYMLKTECPSVPNLANYVLKSSVPKPQPVILDCSQCTKPSGECPPCPRPRCPEVKCPPPTVCPAPAACPRQVCPPTVVKCKSEEAPIQQVRPYLAPLSVTGFGLG